MAKNFRSILATTLVMCMLVSALPMQALAAEDTTITATETITGGDITITFTPTENEGESSVDVSGTNESGATVDLGGSSVTTTETTTDGNGTVTESTSTEVKLTGTETTTDGTIKDVTYQDKTTDTTITETDGTVTEKSVTDGSETKKWEEKDTGSEPGQPVVVAPVVPGETTTATAGVTTETVTNADGSVTTTTTTDRTVITETSEEKVTVNAGDTTLNGLQSVQKFDSTNSAEQKKKTDLYTDTGHFTDTSSVTVTDAPDDYTYKYIGTGDYSGHYVSHIRVIYERDENGNAIKDENGEYVIKELQHSDGTVLTHNGVPTTDLNGPFDQTTGTRPQQFALKNEQGDVVYGYCIDLATGAKSGMWYQVANLEDNTYYATEDAENHVRNIVTNGYWGTAEGTGSISKVREDLKAAVAAGTVDKEYDITFAVREKYTEGRELQDGEYIKGSYVYRLVTEHIVLTDEVIDAFTEGEALDATQSAIWSFANGSKYALDGTDRMIVGDITYASCAMGDSLNGQNDYAGAARTLAFYNYLVSLNEDLDSTVVINDKNNVEDMNLSIGDKVDNHVANQDDDTDNDVYNVDMNFTLAFTPDPLSDDLLVHITYKQNGEDVTIVRRLAGENSEGRTHETITPVDGVYTLTGLQLSENEDFVFDLRLEGTQYLENGVYIYTAQGGYDKSQTFVGMAEGTHSVDVSRSVTISFDVDENNNVVAERTWHDEYDPSNTPPSPPEYPVDPASFEEVPPPQIFRLNNQDGLETIPEEPVPLAAPVITGDNSAMWMAVVLFALFGMVAINLSDKKQRTF